MEGDPNLLPAEYKFTPLRALRLSTRKKMAQYLDLEGTLVVCGDIDVENNYTGLAELAGFSYLDIKNLMRARSPTQEMLDQWTTKEAVTNATIGELWGFLLTMERFDVLHDCRRNILNDCRIYEEHMEIQRDSERYDINQDPTVSNSDMKVDETRCCTIQDVRTNKQTMYDAFVCYTQECPEDVQFVKDMLRELEGNRDLKLFVPGRDDLPGSAMHVINAYLIEVRCKRVVILMSEAFLESPVCDFQVKFAHALAPGARSRKLIPVIRERRTRIPRILRFLSVCDFTKSDMQDWVWERLAMAISAPLHLLEGPDINEEPANNVSLTDIPFPVSQPSGEGANPIGRPSVSRQPVANSSSTAVYQRRPGEPSAPYSVGASSRQTQGSRSTVPPASYSGVQPPPAASSRDYMSLQTGRSSQVVGSASIPTMQHQSRGRGIPRESSDSNCVSDGHTYPSVQRVQSDYPSGAQGIQPNPSSAQSSQINNPYGVQSSQTDSSIITSTVHYV